MEFEIEDNIAIPRSGSGRKAKYPFKDMSVGQSFVVPAGGGNSARKAAWYYRTHHGGRFVARMQPDGSVRIWRVE